MTHKYMYKLTHKKYDSLIKAIPTHFAWKEERRKERDGRREGGREGGSKEKQNKTKHYRNTRLKYS